MKKAGKNAGLSKLIFCSYYFDLFMFLMYCSRAMVIDGASGVGASMLSVNPASLTAWAVEVPKQAIFVSFCLKSGKFCNSDLIPEGLKNTRMS